MRFKSGDIVEIEGDTAINLDLVGKRACVSGISANRGQDFISSDLVPIVLLDSSRRPTNENLSLHQKYLILECFVNDLDGIKRREIEGHLSSEDSRAAYIVLGVSTAKQLKEMLFERGIEELKNFYSSLQPPYGSDELNFLSSFFQKEFPFWAKLIPANGYPKFIEGLAYGIRSINIGARDA